MSIYKSIIAVIIFRRAKAMYVLFIFVEFEASISSSKNHEFIATSRVKVPSVSVIMIDTLSKTVMLMER
jgi:hypothetical protein